MNRIEPHPHIFVVTGAESTGKSTLTKQLAEHYDTIHFPEFARDYVLQLNRKYNYDDVLKIAEEQAVQYKEAISSGKKMVFLDTWLIITKVWFEVVFNRKPSWLDKKIMNAKIEAFLLCDTDIPWVSDPVRENGGKKRVLLHNNYKKNLELFKMNYYVVNGDGKQRLSNAIKIIDRHIK